MNPGILFGVVLLFSIPATASDLDKAINFYLLPAEYECGSTFIGNGLETGGFMPVVELTFLNDQQDEGTCSGTLIAPGKILTAAHCLCGGNRTLSINGIAVNTYQSKQLPGYDCENRRSEDIKSKDVALIYIPEINQKARTALAKMGTYPLAGRSAKKNEAVILVGYGDNKAIKKGSTRNESGAGVKRFGRNTIDTVDGSFIELTGRTEDDRILSWPALSFISNATGENAAALGGDSGSPLLSANREVLGVYVNRNMTGENSAKNRFLPVARGDIRDFILSTQFPNP